MSNQRGQSTVEYAVLAAVVIAALLAMNSYVSRGAMGKLKESADQMGEQFTPLKTSSDFDTKSFSKREEKTNPDGSSSSTLKSEEEQSRTAGAVHVKALDAE